MEPSRALAEPWPSRGRAGSVREEREGDKRECEAGELVHVPVGGRGTRRSEDGQSVTGWAEAGLSR